LIGYDEFLGIELQIIPYKLFSKIVGSNKCISTVIHEELRIYLQPNDLHQVKRQKQNRVKAVGYIISQYKYNNLLPTTKQIF
jgi:hypothetical protein